MLLHSRIRYCAQGRHESRALSDPTECMLRELPGALHMHAMMSHARLVQQEVPAHNLRTAGLLMQFALKKLRTLLSQSAVAGRWEERFYHAGNDFILMHDTHAYGRCAPSPVLAFKHTNFCVCGRTQVVFRLCCSGQGRRILCLRSHRSRHHGISYVHS